MRIRERITGRRSPRVSVWCTGLVALALLAGCSGVGETPRRAEIDSAIALFVSGRYAAAIERLDELAAARTDPEELREVYYYLGRAYLEVGERDRAIDAFAAGVSYGDTGPCVAYLEQLRAVVEGEARNVRRSEIVSRRQLASLLVRQFVLDGAEPPVPEDADDSLREAVSRGWMERLPDGGLHGEAAVTRAAFYVTLARLTADLGVGGTVAGTYAGALSGRGREPVAGSEVAATLEEIAALRNDHGG